ncbi:MAG: DoxX family membrane protein [Anaeromyxobacter sp.]
MRGDRLAPALLRLALSAAFLSAVASRLGGWGGHAGQPAVAFAGFVAAVGELNPWLPSRLWPALAVLVTALEAGLGVALLLGVAPRRTALGAAGLLTVFAVAMTAFTGPKSALDASVFSAAAGAFLLARVEGERSTAARDAREGAQGGAGDRCAGAS